MTRIDSNERYIVVRNMEPFRMIGTVVAINEGIVLSTNAVVSRWFRYSINGADYSHWIELDLTNLNEVKRIKRLYNYAVDRNLKDFN